MGGRQDAWRKWELVFGEKFPLWVKSGLFSTTSKMSSPHVMYHPVAEFQARADACLMPGVAGQYCTVSARY